MGTKESGNHFERELQDSYEQRISSLALALSRCSEENVRLKLLNAICITSVGWFTCQEYLNRVGIVKQLVRKERAITATEFPGELGLSDSTPADAGQFNLLDPAFLEKMKQSLIVAQQASTAIDDVWIQAYEQSADWRCIELRMIYETKNPRDLQQIKGQIRDALISLSPIAAAKSLEAIVGSIGPVGDILSVAMTAGLLTKTLRNLESDNQETIESYLQYLDDYTLSCGYFCIFAQKLIDTTYIHQASLFGFKDDQETDEEKLLKEAGDRVQGRLNTFTTTFIGQLFGQK